MHETRELVVLVHGLWMNRPVMSVLAHRLRRAGYHTALFGFHSALHPYAQHLRNFAAFLGAAQREDRAVHCVGHSMGGVLILDVLARNPDLDIARVVALGSPLRGSLGSQQFMRHAFGRICIGASADLWQSFPALRCPEGVDVGVIAGTERIGLGRFFTDLPDPNDGVVTVEETRLDDLTDHLVLPVSHMGMLFAREVADQTMRFLRTGSFGR